MVKYAGVDFANSSNQKGAMADVLTDKKRENCDQKHADNLLVSLYRNNKNLKEEQSEKY